MLLVTPFWPRGGSKALLLLLLLLLLTRVLLQNLVLPEAIVRPLIPLLGCGVQAKMFVGALRKTLAGGRGRVWPAPSPEQPSKWEDRSSLAHTRRFQHRMSSNTWHQNISRPGQLGSCGIEPRECRGTKSLVASPARDGQPRQGPRICRSDWRAANSTGQVWHRSVACFVALPVAMIAAIFFALLFALFFALFFALRLDTRLEKASREEPTPRPWGEAKLPRSRARARCGLGAFAPGPAAHVLASR